MFAYCISLTAMTGTAIQSHMSNVDASVIYDTAIQTSKSVCVAKKSRKGECWYGHKSAVYVIR